MNKQEVKRLLEAGEIQIENDAPDKLELLREITNYNWSGNRKFYIKNDFEDEPLNNIPIIKLSEITDEEVVWQMLGADDIWYDVPYYCRIKPQTDYANEIEALQNKAKENGEKVVIVFEKL